MRTMRQTSKPKRRHARLDDDLTRVRLSHELGVRDVARHKFLMMQPIKVNRNPVSDQACKHVQYGG